VTEPIAETSPTSSTVVEKNPWWAWPAFVVFALIGIGQFLVPAFIIRPFREQTPQALRMAMAIRQHASLGTFIAAVLCLILTLGMWSLVSKAGKIALATGLVLVALSAIMTRLNYFEWMFHPIAHPGFVAAAQSKLDAAEMLMAVRLGSDARAYPISEMAYHHILNDVVNGEPVTVTY
jgi:hypothetical protein